jgi:excisionase family DNA binding protein
MTGRLLTAEQVAERFQMTPAAVYRLTREGVLPAVRLGRYYRFRPDVLDAWEIEQCNTTRHQEVR